MFDIPGMIADLRFQNAHRTLLPLVTLLKFPTPTGGLDVTNDLPPAQRRLVNGQVGHLDIGMLGTSCIVRCANHKRQTLGYPGHHWLPLALTFLAIEPDPDAVLTHACRKVKPHLHRQ